MTVVVLGWDGLDYDLVERWGLAESFGPRNRPLATFDNPVIGKPHTYEVWPSMVTGVTPDRHGVHAERYTHGASWESPLLNAASVVSKYTIPDRLRWAVGRRIRDHGAEFAFESLEWYRDRGVWTVFDDRQAFPLAIPNVRSVYDEQLGMTTDRGAALAAYMDIETGPNGETIHVPNVSPRSFATRLEADLGEKLGAVRQALKWDFDLIWVWLGYLDTVGHVAPTIDDPAAWQRDGYETAAQWTTFIREQALDDDDLLICVSDHGLKEGAHTHAAFFGWWLQDEPSRLRSVLDVARTVDALAPQSKRRERPHSASRDTGDFETVDAQLRDLGYLE